MSTESRQARYRSRQECVGTKRGAELVYMFPLFNGTAQNAFNSINRQLLLEKTFERHPEVVNYLHSAYSQPSFLFNGDSVIKFCEETQQGDPDSPAFFRIPLRILLTV